MWKTDCEKDSSGSGSLQSIIKVENSSISLSSLSFDDASCTQKEFDLRYSGSYTIKDAAKIKSGGFQVPFKFDTAYATFHTASFISTLNSAVICGYSDWKVGVEKKVPSSMSNCKIA